MYKFSNNSNKYRCLLKVYLIYFVWCSSYEKCVWLINSDGIKTWMKNLELEKSVFAFSNPMWFRNDFEVKTFSGTFYVNNWTNIESGVAVECWYTLHWKYTLCSWFMAESGLLLNRSFSGSQSYSCSNVGKFTLWQKLPLLAKENVGNKFMLSKPSWIEF